jgi:DNA primase
VGLRIDVADLPTGSDPADLLRAAGPDALAEALARTRPLVDAVVDSKLDAHEERLRWAEGRVSAVRTVTPLIASMSRAPHARSDGSPSGPGFRCRPSPTSCSTSWPARRA